MPFKKGDKPKNGFDKRPQQINRHGRPKDHDGLRKLIQRIAAEAVDGKPEWSQIELMLRAMMKSKSAVDRIQILEHGWGKVIEEKKDTVNGEVLLRVIYGDKRDTNTLAEPASQTTLIQEQQGKA